MSLLISGRGNEYISIDNDTRGNRIAVHSDAHIHPAIDIYARMATAINRVPKENEHVHLSISIY